MAMTYSTLASVVKYPYTSMHAGKKGKFGFFESEDEIFRRVAGTLGIPETEEGKFVRHPLVYVVEAADDICYQIMDIEDAHKLKILSTAEVSDLMLGFFDPAGRDRAARAMARLDDPNEKIAYLRSSVVGSLVTDSARAFMDHEQEILNGTFRGSLLDSVSPELQQAYGNCSQTAWDKIYCAREVVDIEIAGNRIITYLMGELVDAVMHPERNSARLLLNIIPKQYDTRATDPYTRLQSALDHVSGMTDVYALDLYRKLNGHSLPAV
jgi:putative dGTPase